MDGSACIHDDTIFGYVAGELSRAEMERTERHLADCPACCALIAETVKLMEERSAATSRGPEEQWTLGRYTIRGMIGRGGMSVVYAAHDPNLHRQVAIKIVRPDVSQGLGPEESRARLLREARAMARVSDPNVVTVYDVGDWGDRVFIAMELVEGPTLRTWMKDRSWQDVLHAFHGAARGLWAAHATGLVHRDFKPENVLMTKNDRAKVTDFGLARPAAGASLIPGVPGNLRAALTSLTETGAFIGTPAYMAPEQFAGLPADARTDQFGFCVALFEALYGSRPFTGGTTDEIILSMVHGQIRFPANEGDVPAAMRDVLLKGLSIDPNDRYPSMESLLDALALAASRPVTARARRQARYLWFSVAAAGVLGTAAVMGTVLRRSAAREHDDAPVTVNEDIRATLDEETPTAAAKQAVEAPAAVGESAVQAPSVETQPVTPTSAAPAERTETRPKPRARAGVERRTKSPAPAKSSAPRSIGDKLEDPF